MKNFKKSLVALGLGVSLLLASNTAQAISGNTVVATYSGNIVLLSDIKPYLKTFHTEQYSEAEIHKAVQAYVLKNLRAKWEAKARQNVSITNADVENVLYDLAAKNGLTYNDFIAALAYHGINLNTYKANIKKSLYQSRLNQFYSENIKSQLNNEQIEFEGTKAYEINKANGTLAKINTSDVSYILIKVNPLVSGQQAKAKIDLIHSQLNKHELTFSQAATKYSDDIISAANGGKLGQTYTLPNKEKTEIEQNIKRLSVDQYTKPFFLNGQGWVIVQLNGTSKVTADLQYYIDQAFQKEIKDKYSTNSLDQFFLNSVIIKYKDFASTK